MVDINDLVFQKLDFHGLCTLVKWAEEEGWNPGHQDAWVFWATDPEGFYGYYHKGNLLAGGSIVSYDGSFGFMGFFIVKPEYRSSGIGRKLWYERRETLLGRLDKGASIGMDGVIAMQPFYEEGGFKIAFRNERHEKIGKRFEVNKNISPITKIDSDLILDYDIKCFGYPRPRFLIPWLNLPHARTFKYMDNGRLKGFAIVRKAMKGYKICPLFADNATIAEELYRACLNSATNEPVYIDVPVVNAAAVELVNKYKTTYVFECARMYYGSPPDVELDKVFGITTFELG